MAMLRFRPRRSSPAEAPLMSGQGGSATHRNGPPDPAGPAPGGRVTIKVETRQGVTTVVVNGELDLVTRPYLTAQLALATRDRPGRIVFDLGGTLFMDCGSARLIVDAGRWLPDGGRPVIRRPGPGVRRILELTGLDAHCEIEP